MAFTSIHAGIFFILSLIAMTWVILDVWNTHKSRNQKILWTVLAVFFSIITAIVYYIMEKI